LISQRYQISEAYGTVGVQVIGWIYDLARALSLLYSKLTTEYPQRQIIKVAWCKIASMATFLGF